MDRAAAEAPARPWSAACVLRAHPIVIRDAGVNLAPADERPDILGRFAGLCAELGTATTMTADGGVLEVAIPARGAGRLG